MSALGTTFDIIDQAVVLVRRLPDWTGVLLLAALPARLLTVLLAWQIWELGAAARDHGTAITSLAFLVLAAWLVAQAGRASFSRACRCAQESQRPEAIAILTPRLPEFSRQLYLALVLELLFWATLPALVLAPFLLLAAGLAPAVASHAPSGLVPPWRALAAALPAGPCLLLILLFAIVMPIVAANLHLAVLGSHWLLAGATLWDLGAWNHILSLSHPLYLMLLLAAVSLVVEPFWLASLTVLAMQARARRSGEDLVQWFDQLLAREPR